ncbi:uncharacterized protein METZ01_LOCUS369643, partial [marine metagenome]
VVVEVLDVTYRLVDSRKTGADSIGQDPALCGKAYPSVVPLEEGTAEPSLQLPDRMTDRRLSDLQLVGRTGKTLVAGHDGEGIEALERGQITKIRAGSGSDLIHDSMRLLIIYKE